NEDAIIKKYVSELVANIAGNDIELSALCIKNYRLFLGNPSEQIKTITNEEVRSGGTDFIYKKDFNEIEHLIWLAQIKTIYPFIEEYREDFVKKYSVDISKKLPIEASYGEVYSDPKDVELGTLVYMAGCGDLVLNGKEYEKLKKFKDARNKLSHLSTLNIEEINELL
nr:hypothetical protein [Lachnospiraceae bacterium]